MGKVEREVMAPRDAHPALANGSRTHIYSDSNVYYVLNAQETPAVVTVAAVAIGRAGSLSSSRAAPAWRSPGTCMRLR